MDRILLILQHTPLWAVAVLVVLIVFGIQSLRPRTLPMWRVLVVPAAFILWGAVGVMGRSAAFPMSALDWLVTAAAGFAIAWVTTDFEGIRIDGRQIRLPGSVIPLVRNLLVFLTRYALTAAIAVAPTLQGALAPWDVAVSGISAGYFAGWLWRLGLKYRERWARPQPSVS